MGAKISDEMKRARALMKAGKSAAEAARTVGLHRSAPSKDPECRKMIQQQKEARNAEKIDSVD